MSRKRVHLASAALMAVACCLPAITFLGSKGDSHMWPGFAVLALGWLAFYYGQFAWFANFFWALGGVLLIWKKVTASRVCSALALLLAVNCVTLRSLRIPEDESGGPQRASVQSLGPGFYLWLVSLAVLLVATFWKKETDSSQSTSAAASS